MTERHFSVNELAELWNVSDDTVRRIFKEESGVIRLVRQSKGRRAKVYLRIPESVALRVYRRSQQIAS